MSVARLCLVWVAMLALLALSMAGTFLPIGMWRQAISLGVAATKGALILWFFMDLRRSGGLDRLAMLAGLTFLAIMMTMLCGDYMTRGWLGA